MITRHHRRRSIAIPAAALIMPLLLGCDGGEGEAPVQAPLATAAASPTDPAQSTISRTGYVNTQLGFGVGFHDEWTVIGPEELNAAADKAGITPEQRQSLIHLRQGTDVIKIVARPMTTATARAALEESAANLERLGTATVEPVVEEMIGGRSIARLGWVDQMSNSFYGRQYAFAVGDRLVVLSAFSTNHALIDDLESVVETLTFY